MELKEGMYVRINNNFRTICIGIGKVVKIFNDTVFVKISKFDSPISFEKDEISDFKNNIIDLIEEGDYVNGVEVIGKEFDNFNKEYLQCGVGDYVICTFEVKDIKTILTKEQFESMKYIVESE